MREAWQLRAHQKITPGFAEKLCFTATATGSYEEAAQVASKWAQSLDDSTLHALVQRMGARAEEQAQSRYEQAPQERLPQRAPSTLGVIMVDGCQMRYRGAGWGKKKTNEQRVEWHELKLGVYYGHEQSAHTQAGRGMLMDKLVVSWQDQATELGRRLNWEALREGLGRAQNILYLGDGAEWVWNLKKAANIYGVWDELCMEKPSRSSRGGSNRSNTNCATDPNDGCCVGLLSSRSDAVKLAR